MERTIYRPRRLRANPAIRRLVQETILEPRHLILPLFLVPGQDIKKPVASMPGVFQLSIDQAILEARAAQEAGVGGVILFGVPHAADKDAEGRGAYDPNGLVQQAGRRFKEALPDLYLIADLCLCEYTDHGHCGVLHGETVDNDATLTLLGQTAVTYAEAGIDMTAPSGMMDNMVAAIRAALDGAGHSQTPILSYAVKYSSAFYGPFRDAAENTPTFGDRRSYQMDPANGREALREAALDVEQGADMIMVKPGLPYLDIIRQLRDRYALPIATYQVSGEYAMMKAAVERGWLEEDRAVLETLTSFRRAGADLILTYYATQAARLL